MSKAEIEIAQAVLAKGAGYVGRIDGKAGPKTSAASWRAPGQRPADWARFSSGRRAIAAAQMVLKSEGFDPGAVDGFMGPRTEAAAEAYIGDPWARPAQINGKSVWGNEATLSQVFGPPAGPDTTKGRVRCPWRMVTAWDQSQPVGEIGCHALVAPSLSRIFEEIADTYKAAEIRALGLHLYGGCYNPRRKRGGAEWSTHAYGVALDLDPLRNRLRWGADRARLAQEDARGVWEAFEREGWTSLGRVANFDWMHVQAPAV